MDHPLHRRRRFAIYLLTLLTGSTGLVYEIVWQKYLSRLLGSDSLATAIVLGVFLGGLSLGYYLCGRWTLRVRNLFVAYGVLEAAIGLWAVGFPWLFSGVDRWTGGWAMTPPWGLVGQGLLCTVVLLAPPTLCMGGTVPLLTRALALSAEDVAAVQARVYGINTAGACLGALAAGFVLLPTLGLPATLRWTGPINLLAAGFFVWLGAVVARPAGGPARDAAPSTAALARASTAWLHGIALAAGLCFMTLETLLIRVVGLSLGSASYSLSLVLAACILSIAVGALWVARRRTIRPSTLVGNQIAVGCGLAVLFVTLDLWPYGAHLLRISLAHDALVSYYLAAFAGLTLLLVVPLGCMGATLPLVFALVRRDVEHAGSTAGALLAWNALGNLLGGVVGGFLILRLWNLGQLFLAISAIVAASTWLAAGATGASRRWAWVPTLLTVGLILFFPYDPLRFAVGTFRLREPLEYSYRGPAAFYAAFQANRTVLAYRDDPEGTFAVVENPSPLDALAQTFPSLSRSIRGRLQTDFDPTSRPRAVMINGKSDSNTYFDRATLKLAAHLPGLLVRRRDDVFVIGLGTGVTAGEFSLYPDVQSIEVAEIAPAVVRFLPFFEPANHGIRNEPRLRIDLGDALRVLRRSERSFAIISSEPSNPWVVGVDQLFSREFYRIVRDRLESGGVFVQWVQRYATNERVHALVIRTLASEFPHVRLFRIPNADDLLLASLEPVAEEASERGDALLARNDRLRESLESIGIDSMADLFALEVHGAAEAAARAERDEIESLDRPRLHYLSGRAFFRGDGLDRLPGPTAD